MNRDSNHERDYVNTCVIDSPWKITVVKTMRERLKHARMLRGMTQARLAEAAGCAQSAIGNIESGERTNLRNLVDVARVLNVSVDWLYDGKGPGPTGLPAGDESPGKVIAMEAVRSYDNSSWPFVTVPLHRVLALPAIKREMIASYILGVVESHDASVKKTAGA